MTQAKPQSELSPIVAVPSANGRLNPKVYTDEALEVKELQPVPTSWKWEEGRPIYDRLPSASQTYNMDFPGQPDSVYVYIDPKLNNAIGPGSLQVAPLNTNASKITIQSGIMTWRWGQAPVDALAIDITTLNNGLGLSDGEYQIGYLLEYAIAEVDETTLTGYDLYSVTDHSLATAAVSLDVSSARIDYPEYSFTTVDLAESWQPNELAKAGPYSTGSSLTFDFRSPVVTEKFELSAQDASLATAPMATYFSENLIIWYKDNEVKPIDGQWTSLVRTDKAYEYWRLFFWDGFVNVNQLSYSGEAYFPITRTASPITLVEPYIDDYFADIEQSHTRLASFTVQNGSVGQVVDTRRVIYRKFEPVADWLTVFEDENLKKLFNQVENYAPLMMAPPTSAVGLYDELLENYSFEIGSELDAPRIVYPTVVQLTGENSIQPSAVIQVADAIEDGDLTNKVTADAILNSGWSIDNGNY